MTRFTAPLIALLLCGTTLAGCASDGGGMLSGLALSKKPSSVADAAGQSADAAAMAAAPSMDIEGAVRQAQSQRLAGRYDDAIHTLSQVMLIASDDPRVIGEYGKTLTEKGRGQEAVQFLTRATELQPNEWSLYSALGVAYDQVGNPSSARMAYEQALKLKPNEPSILNNYALSRMIANDPDTARQLIARAQAAGGASDPKIARNNELVNKLAPAAQAQPVAEQKTATADSKPVSAPTPAPVNSSPLPAAAPSAQNISVQTHPVAASPAAASKVVMQPVPVDPLAGPVKSAATHSPTPLVAHAGAKTEEAALKPDVKDAHAASEKGPMVGKNDAPKPAANTDAKTSAKTDVKPVKAELAKPATSSTAVNADAKPDTKTAVKPEAKPVKAVAAEAKPDAKPAAKPGSKTAIPDLRQTASVY
ncbi:MAG: tetratricopeptide repeat protein [Rhizomicrobium sp.]